MRKLIIVLVFALLTNTSYAQENPYKYVPDAYYNFSMGFNNNLFSTLGLDQQADKVANYATDTNSTSYQVGKITYKASEFVLTFATGMATEKIIADKLIKASAANTDKIVKALDKAAKQNRGMQIMNRGNK